MRQSWCSSLPGIAEDKFHARLMLANCMPLSIKFIFSSQKLTIEIFWRILKPTVRWLSYLDSNWAVAAEVSPPPRAPMIEIKLTICLHAYAGRLHV